jgi:hypothetical protein
MSMMDPNNPAWSGSKENRSTAFMGTEGLYMLPHHVKEIERLRKQHIFMNTTTDGILLNTPNICNADHLKVLDAGCADGGHSEFETELSSKHLNFEASRLN